MPDFGSPGIFRTSLSAFLVWAAVVRLAPIAVRQGSELRTLPKAGQPASFTGGIGMLRITASAEPTRVRVGDPITVSVRVAGTGNLEDVAPPRLGEQPRWAADFKIDEEATAASMQEDAKLFRLTVRAKHAGVRELPAIRLGYFNPRSNRYEESISERIPIEVQETERLDPAELVAATPRSEPDELRERDAGLAANYTGPRVLRPHGPYRVPRPLALAGLVAPPIVWLSLYAAHRAARRGRDPARRRARHAYRRAIEQLRASDATPDQVARAVRGYLADRLGIPPGELLPLEAGERVLRLTQSPELASALTELLEACDRARFAPPSAPRDAEPLSRRAEQLIERAESADRAPRPQRPGAFSLRLWGIAPFIALAGVEQPLDRSATLAQAESTFEQGVRASDPQAARQAFAEAAARYRALVVDGVENGELDYDLANALFRAGDVPRAILWYRRAQWLLPRDSNIAANLGLARSRLADRLPDAAPAAVPSAWAWLERLGGMRGRMRSAGLAYALAWLLFCVRIRVPSRWLTVSAFSALALSFMLGGSVLGQLRAARQHPVGVVVAPGVVVRTGDGESYEPRLSRPLGPGVEFRLVARRRDWLCIELAGGKAGWIRAEEAELAALPAW